MIIRRKITAMRFEALAPELGSSELVHGKIVRISPGGLEHNGVVGNVYYALSGCARRSKRGRAYTGKTGIVVEENPDTVRGAAVAYFSFARLPKSQTPRGFARVAPELVVEVLGLDRTWRRAVTKAGEYFDLGVSRVWIVDPGDRRVHVLRPDGPPISLSTRATLRDPEILPGFAVRVAEFFSE